MDLVEKYYEILYELMAIEPILKDKGKNNVVRRRTNEIYEKVVDIANVLAQNSRSKNEDIKTILATEEQKVAYLWFMYFSNRKEFRKLLETMNNIGNHIRKKETRDLLRKYYHGYQVYISFLPIAKHLDKKASERRLEIIINTGFVSASIVILEDIVDFLISNDVVDEQIVARLAIYQVQNALEPREGVKQNIKDINSRQTKSASDQRQLKEILDYSNEFPNYKKINAVILHLSKGAGTPIGDYHNLLEIHDKVNALYFENKPTNLGVGWAILPDEKTIEVDHENGWIFVQSTFDDKSMPVFVLEGVIYYGILSIIYNKRFGKDFESRTEFKRQWQKFDKFSAIKGAIQKFKSEKEAEARHIREADDDFKMAAQRLADARQNITGQNVSGDIVIRVGVKTGTTVPIIWAPGDKKFPISNQHIVCVGKSGSGKTQSLKNIIFSLQRVGVPVIVFDFHAEFVTSSGGDDFQSKTGAVVLEASDGIDLNPLAIQIDPTTGRPYSFVNSAYQVSDALAKILGLGAIQRSHLKNAIVNAYRNDGFDARDYKTWLRTPPPFSAIMDELIRLESVNGTNVSNLISRVEPFFETGIFKGTQGSMTQFFTKGRVTIIRLSSLPNDEMRVAVSQFFLMKIYELMLALGPTERQRLFITIEEAHKLKATEKLIALLKESRKFGIGTLLSSQNPKDFDPAILSNVGTVISLQLETDDAKHISKYLGSNNTKTQHEIMDQLTQLNPGQALLRNNRYNPYVPVSMIPFNNTLRRK